MSKLPYRILVVDDETDLHLLFKKRFHDEVKDGILEIQFALNGAEALEKLKEENSFQIVFTDIVSGKPSPVSPQRGDRRSNLHCHIE